jgi:large conductance mechanosensitive channel
MLGEFRAFLLKTNALALAIGVIIGAALGNVVNSLVVDIIMPPIGFALGKTDFSALNLDLGSGVVIRWGAFLQNVVSFVIIAFVVWQISKSFIKDPPPAEAKTCPFCREANAVDASKCRACASAI